MSECAAAAAQHQGGTWASIMAAPDPWPSDGQWFDRIRELVRLAAAEAGQTND